MIQTLHSTRRVAAAIIFVLATVSVSSCGYNSGSAPVIAPSCVEIVAFRTNTLLRGRTRDNTLVRNIAVSFGASLANEATRIETVQKWQNDTNLAAIVDLEMDIFEPVQQEEEWSEAARKDNVDPASVPDAAFVRGLRQGLEMLGKE